MANTNVAVTRIEIDSTAFRKGVNKVNKELRGIRGAAQRAGNQLSMMFKGFLTFKAVQGLRAFVDEMARVERLDSVLKGVSASSQQFNESLAFLAETARENAVDLGALTEGFAQFSSAAQGAGLTMQQQQDIFKGMAASFGAFQLNAAQSREALVGLRQMMSSTNIQLEDLRQVTDRIPNAMQALSEVTKVVFKDTEHFGKSVKELASDGAMMASEILPLWADRLRELNQDAAARNTKTFAGAVNNLSIEIMELARQLRPVINLIATFISHAAQFIKLMGQVAQGARYLANVGNVGLDNVLKTGVEDDPDKHRMELNARLKNVQDRMRLIHERTLANEASQAEIDERMGLIASEKKLQQEVDRLRSERGSEIFSMTFEPNLKPVDVASEIKEAGDGGGGGGGGGGGRKGKSAAEKQAEDLKKLEDQFMRLRESYDPVLAAQNKHAENIALINELNAQRPIDEKVIREVTVASAKEITEAQEAAKNATLEWGDVWEAFSSTAGDALTSIMDKTKSAGEAVKDLVKQFLRMLANKAMAQAMSAIGTAIGFADGGVMTSKGPMPLRKYAAGGVANSPQVALYGEGSRPEAYVPLPDGRRIPVAMEGGSGASVTVNQNFDFTGANPATALLLRQEAGNIVQQSKQAVLAAIGEGGSYAQAVGVRG